MTSTTEWFHSFKPLLQGEYKDMFTNLIPFPSHKDITSEFMNSKTQTEKKFLEGGPGPIPLPGPARWGPSWIIHTPISKYGVWRKLTNDSKEMNL